MSSSRYASTTSFRPTRTTRSTTASSSTAQTTATRPSRLPSQASVTNGRTSSIPSSKATSTGLGRGNGSALGPSETTGLKRKARTASVSAEPEQPTTTKKPALSSAFSAHTTQTALQRQLLAAQTQITELQNSLLEKQGKVDRLEADLRLMATREEEEREARIAAERELSQTTDMYESQLMSARKIISELEADNDDLTEAYDRLQHDSESQITKLKSNLSASDQQIKILQSQVEDAESRAKEQEERAKELEEYLESLEEGEDEDGEEENEISFDEANETKSIKGENTGAAEEEKEKVDSTNPQSPSSVEDSKNETEEDELEGEVDIDADGEEDLGESGVVVEAHTSVDGEKSTDMEIVNSGEQTNSEFPPPTLPEAYPDPGAPPPFAISSPPSEASSIRSRSESIDSDSVASSHAMSVDITRYDDTPHRAQHTPSENPASESASVRGQSFSRLDPLSHIRRRLSHGTPRLRRSSLGLSSSSASLSRARERDKDKEIIRAELARQTAHLATLEATNSRLSSELSRLRPRAEGAEVLREEKRELERRLEGVEAMRQQLAELEAEKVILTKHVSELEYKLQNQEQLGKDANASSQTPVSVSRQLAALRKTHTALLDEHGQLKASLRACEVELSEARQVISSTSEKLDSQNAEIAQLREAFARKEKDRELLERDVTFLKSLVTSYKTEETSFMEEGDSMNDASREKLEQRILQLETLLSDYKKTVESLEAEVDQLQRARAAASGRPQEQWDQLVQKITSLTEELNEAQEEISGQAEQVEELEQRLFELGGEIGSGRHIPPSTRILSLRENPAQEWADTRKQVLDNLKKENEALLERVKQLEENGVSSTGQAISEDSQLVPRASLESLRMEIRELHETMKQKDKRLTRLREVFTAKSEEFKEAITSILGLKLAFYPNGSVRVTSVYDLAASFLFIPSKQKGEKAKMQLFGTVDGEVPVEFQGIINTWIGQEMSIPCFMASITLECFDKWKMENRELAEQGIQPEI